MVNFILIRMLKNRGISSVYSKTLGKAIDLSMFDIYKVIFIPVTQHTVRMDTFFATVEEEVEPLFLGYCEHCMLQ